MRSWGLKNVMQFWYLRRTSPPPWLPPFTQMRIRNKHTANMEEHQGAGFPGLVQHGYPTWTSKLGGTEWMRVWPLLLCTVPQLQKGPDVKGKGAFRELTVCKTRYAPCRQQRKERAPNGKDSSPVAKTQSSATGAFLVQGGEGTCIQGAREKCRSGKQI